MKPCMFASDIGVRILDRVPDAGLCSQMNNLGEAIPLKQRFGVRAMSKIELLKAKTGIGFEQIQARQLEAGIIIVVDVVNANHVMAFRRRR